MQDAYVPPFLGSRISKRWQYLLSIQSVCLVSAVCFLFSAYIGAEVVAFVLLLTLSLIAMFFDILPVLLTAVLSALIWDYFFLLPRYNFRVGNTEDEILLSMYFVIALVNAVLTFKIRQIEKIARQKEEKAKTLKLYNTLLNSLSHEFRTPIAAIIGATDNLLEEPSRLSREDSKKLLTEISVASMRLNRHVENLLNMSRLESGFIQPKKDWHDIHEMVSSILHQLEEPLFLRKPEVAISDGFPLVRLDYGLMEQVLYNLLFNAALYTPEGSWIRISAEGFDELLVIIVEDDGPGFPEEEIDRVFEKFYRLKDSRIGGSGLGLSIVKGFVEAHNGTIALTNRPSGGARFLISLPACLPARCNPLPSENLTLQLSVS
ncbi:ATP-binding protein [Flavitalea sp. BT771]|uniref:sensor histidine kinase n=1 Tax=Flavitalea sp. BT771 TaxID=3063329 RepID=UPI0026E49525|nr:ATP-binding protein [Flavitalea sp. BT771]MDO6431035.1 ATP-binding protein [Flavitalea sp. BT771]MDV6219942.1 ATP-binding protein [Flavitalea sp. BT771]